MTRNWKTTLAGIAAGLCMAAKGAVDPKYHAMLEVAANGALALGLCFAADSLRGDK
jgi:hypothetical protein